MNVIYTNLVVDTFTAYNVRIMSDVWANVYKAVILNLVDDPKYDPNAGMFRTIIVGDSEFGANHLLKVDACEDLLEVYRVWKLGKAFSVTLDAADSAFRTARYGRASDLAKVEKGKTVRVTRGRKVPRGTEGLVFWLGESGYGTRVGLALPEEDGSYAREGNKYTNVVFVDIKNVDVIDRLGGRVFYTPEQLRNGEYVNRDQSEV